MNDAPNLRQILQSELIMAMKNEDRAKMKVLRTAIGAIDNREAVPAPSATRDSEQVSAYGEMPRRALSHQEMKLVLMDEVESRRNSIGYLGTAGGSEEAAELENEIAILERYIYLS